MARGTWGRGQHLHLFLVERERLKMANAVCVLKGEGNVGGTVRFTADGNGTRVEAEVTGLTPGTAHRRGVRAALAGH